MTSKSDFSADEWNQLLESVMIAGVAVTVADPSGLWGTLKEGTASARTMAEGRSDNCQLIRDVVADFGTSEGRGIARDGLREKFKGSTASGIKENAIDSLRRVGSLLDDKAPDDAGDYKRWLRDISQKVAEAAKEGGFMGFGGVLVSDAEKATLDDISQALDI